LTDAQLLARQLSLVDASHDQWLLKIVPQHSLGILRIAISLAQYLHVGISVGDSLRREEHIVPEGLVFPYRPHLRGHERDAPTILIEMMLKGPRVSNLVD